MANIDDFKIANDLLGQVLGGRGVSLGRKVYTFSGAYAVQEAEQVIDVTKNCGCSCMCNDGAGSGGGAGN